MNPRLQCGKRYFPVSAPFLLKKENNRKCKLSHGEMLRALSWTFGADRQSLAGSEEGRAFVPPASGHTDQEPSQSRGWWEIQTGQGRAARPLRAAGQVVVKADCVHPNGKEESAGMFVCFQFYHFILFY